MKALVFAAAVLGTAAHAGDLTIENPMVPLAPPAVMAHAAYFTITNNGDTARQLIGVSAEGYAMAHLHRSEVKDGIATMSAVDVIDIAPGQSIAFEHGGLHVMLMRPEGPKAEGDTVTFTLEFADGTTETVAAPVKPRAHGS